MTKEWVEEKNRLIDEKYKNYPQVIFDTFNEFLKKYEWGRMMVDTETYYTLKYLEVCKKYNEKYDAMEYDLIPIRLNVKNTMLSIKHDKEDEYKLNALSELYRTLSQMCEEYYQYVTGYNKFDFALDSDPMYFNGDIIITDPCYLKDGMNLSEDVIEDRDLCMAKIDECFENGIGMQRNTIYGDWSCTTFDMNTKQPIGEFCADGGMVCVIKLDDVFAFNPNFNYHTEKTWTTTLIKDFCGTVQFKVKEEPYEYEGKQEVDYIVFVEGHGVNKVTGEKIDFITSQTGF